MLFFQGGEKVRQLRRIENSFVTLSLYELRGVHLGHRPHVSEGHQASSDVPVCPLPQPCLKAKKKLPAELLQQLEEAGAASKL